MKITPVKYEIYTDDDQLLIGTLQAVCDSSFSLTISDKIVSPDELRSLADKLEAAIDDLYSCIGTEESVIEKSAVEL